MNSTYHRAIKAISPQEMVICTEKLINANSCHDSRTLINENAECPPQSSPPVHIS